MNRDVLELECQLRLIDLCKANVGQPPPEPLDLYVEGFWAALQAISNPRSAESLQLAIEAARQEHSPCAQPIPNQSLAPSSENASKRPRRRPDFSKCL